MNKSLRSELRKISGMAGVIILTVLLVLTYLDYRGSRIFHKVINQNNLLNEMYHNMEAMEKNLVLYMRTGEKVYFESHIYFGDRLYRYLENLSDAAPDKKYVINFVERMKQFNDSYLSEIRQIGDEKEADLQILYQSLEDSIIYTKAWIMKDLEINTREYQKQMNEITGIRYTVIALLLLLAGGLYVGMSRKFINILRTLKIYQDNAQALSRQSWDVPDVAGDSYEELDELAKAMDHMKNEIRSYIIQMKKNNQLEAQLREEKLRTEKKDRALAESKLRELHAKIDPHFLFNALNLVGKFAMLEEPERAMEIIEGISKILRYCMETTEQFVGLTTELDIVQTYIFVQKCRFGDKISYRQEIAPEAQKIKIPSMTLQPLVENCFKHGLKDLDQITITIRANDADSGTEIEVSDNGNGVADVENIFRRGIGLKGVAERFELLYHRNDLLHVESQKGKFTKVLITIPKESNYENINSRR